MKDSSPSATSRLIAAATLLVARSPQGTEPVPPDMAAWCETLLATTGGGRLLRWMTSSRLGRAVGTGLDRLTHPGIILHYLLRKRRIEQAWQEARREGFTQLLVIGAGFDTLGLRTAADPSLRVIEVDHPATQSAKKRVAPGTAVCFVEARLERDGALHDLSGILDASRATFVILEGVLMYLSETQVTRLLGELRRLNVPSLRLCMTFMERWPDGRIGFLPRSRLVEWWLRFRGEPFLWWLASSDLPQFLAARGYRVSVICDGRALGGTLNGESVAIAEQI
jgi:methyltransferase (TIGR00027 family)